MNNGLESAAGNLPSLASAEAALQRGELDRAHVLVTHRLQEQPDHVDTLVLAGRVAQQRGDVQAALHLAERGLRIEPEAVGAAMLQIELLLQTGQRLSARQNLDKLADRAGRHARLSHDIAQLYMHLDEPREAEAFYARATATEPQNPAYWYNYSTALIALGRMDAAEQALDRTIALQGDDGDAWYNRATLRRQTAGRNHVDAIQAQLERCRHQPQSQVPLYFALAKEQEDLGQHEPAFTALQKGARMRRKMLSYRVADDEATMGELAAAFDADYFAREQAACTDSRPVFVLGLPRSGTTLVDRILSSHSQIGSRGESSSLALNLMRQAGTVASKAELIRRSIGLDKAALGDAFCAELPALGCARIIDKTPANFLYLGLVAKALPNARIIHLRRDPMDVCYAMYKTLFRMAYPFSYDLDDLARYWLAYDRLMKHWHKHLPAQQMLEVEYESLVHDPERVTRQMLAHLDMPFEPRCLAFDRNPAPSLTASAAQVRQPIYTSSVGLWRKYQTQLAPLAERLRRAGVAIAAAEASQEASG